MADNFKSPQTKTTTLDTYYTYIFGGSITYYTIKTKKTTIWHYEPSRLRLESLDRQLVTVYVSHVTFEAAFLRKSFTAQLAGELRGYSAFVFEVPQ